MTERDKTDFFFFWSCKSKKTVESLRCDWSFWDEERETVKEKENEE